jgi:hypothetical protein
MTAAARLLRRYRATSAPRAVAEGTALRREESAMSHIVSASNPAFFELSSHVVESDAVQVRILWGDEPLEVIELSPPRSFYVGDGAVCREPVDFTVPDATERVALLTVEHGRVTVQASGGAELLSPDEPASLPEVAVRLGTAENPFFASSPFANAFERPPEPYGVPRAGDQTPCARVRMGALCFEFRVGTREQRCPRAFDADEGVRPLAFFAASSLLVGTFAAVMAYFTPPLGLTDDEGPDRDQLIQMNAFLDASAEREREREQEHANGNEQGAAPDAPEQPARGEAGRIGHPSPIARSARGSGAEQGPKERPAMSREEAIRAAADFGMIGMLRAGAAAANLAAWDDPGIGALAREGGFFGTDLEQSGAGGLALTGKGEGGGGKSNQIGLGRIGTCQGAECDGIGKWGLSAGRTGGTHVAQAPRVRTGVTQVLSGSLPPEVIQRVVRQSFGRFRGCYEDGLRTNPTLEGRVTARFVIARDGSVATVQSGGSDLPDSRVVACVLRTYSSLSFPPPREGIVTVTYPLSFTPSA